MELSVCPVHVKIYQLAFKYYYRTEKLIKSTDNHNVPFNECLFGRETSE